ncbi:MAG: hypothetical protein ABR560_02310, partial [Bacteroidales bacterium]
MKTRGFILFLAAAFLLPLNAEAQLGSKLKKKLEETVGKALGEEAAEDSTVQDDQPAGEQRQFDLSKLGVGKVTAKYDENYSFKGMLQMKTEMFDKGKPAGVMDSDIWFDAANGNLG